MTTLHDVKIEPRWFDRIQQNEKVWRRRREGSAPVEPTRSGRPVRASQPVPGLRSRARRLVRRNRREQSHPRPAPITPALRALLFQSAGTVLMLVGGALAGVGIGALVLAVGLTAAAWIAVAVSVLVLIVGAVDHVRTHP